MTATGSVGGVHVLNRGDGGHQKTAYSEALRSGADVVVIVPSEDRGDEGLVGALVAPIRAGNADLTVGPRGARGYSRACLLSVPFLRCSDARFDAELLAEAVASGQRVVDLDRTVGVRNLAENVRCRATALARRARRGWSERDRPAARGRPTVGEACVLCGGTEHVLVYAATATGHPPVEEFACTTTGLSEHDDIVQCRGCGLLKSVASLGAEEILANYADVVDPTYLDEELSRRELFAWLTSAMGGYYVPGRRLLEVGANVGLFLSVAAEQGWQARGVEPSAWAVKEGRERFGVDLRQGTIESLDEERAGADVVAMFDVIEHLVDPLAALRTLRRLLDDDGLLVLSTPNAAGLHARVRKGAWPWFIRSHLFYFTPRTLASMLQKAGFSMVEWTPVPRAFHLSYIAHRTRGSLGALSTGADALAKVVDLKLPMGWLGDIMFVAARPTGEG